MNIDIKKIEQNCEITDDKIMLGEPLTIIKYGQKIQIGQINWWHKWEKFIYYLGIFLNYYYVICENSKLPDRLSDIEEFRNNIAMTIGVNKKAFMSIMKICGFTGAGLRWMKNTFTIDDYIEVFIYLYLYNVKGVKKNLLKGLEVLSKT